MGFAAAAALFLFYASVTPRYAGRSACATAVLHAGLMNSTATAVGSISAYTLALS